MKDKTISLKHYWRIFLQKNKLCFVTAVIGIMLISIFDLIFSLVMQAIIDIVSEGNISGMVSIIKFSIVMAVAYLPLPRDHRHGARSRLLRGRNRKRVCPLRYSALLCPPQRYFEKPRADAAARRARRRERRL